MGASSPHPSPTEAPALPRALLRGLLLPILAWLALAAVLALAAGVGPAAVAQGGWRLHAYRELAVAAFLLALVAGGWAAIAHELRRRTAKRAGDARE